MLSYIQSTECYEFNLHFCTCTICAIIENTYKFRCISQFSLNGFTKRLLFLTYVPKKQKFTQNDQLLIGKYNTIQSVEYHSSIAITQEFSMQWLFHGTPWTSKLSYVQTTVKCTFIILLTRPPLLPVKLAISSKLRPQQTGRKGNFDSYPCSILTK